MHRHRRFPTKLTGLPFCLPLALALVAGASFAPTRAEADLSAQVRSCRASISKASSKLVKALVRSVTTCHNLRDRDSALAATDCNDPEMGPGASKATSAELKFSSILSSPTGKCSGVTPADALYDACPPPCENNGLPTMDILATCLRCLALNGVQTWSEAIHGTPTSPLPSEQRGCDSAVGKGGSKLFNAIVKDVSACQMFDESAGSETATYCTSSSFPSSEVDDATMTAENTIVAGCDQASFSDLDSCSNSQFGIAECVGEQTKSSAQQVVGNLLWLPVFTTTTTTTTTTTSTTTTTLVGDPQCPDLGELQLLSHHSHITCNTNADCPAPRTCDTEPMPHICVSKSDLDSGWTGLAHDSDLDNDVLQRSRLICPGPAPTCGECVIAGVEPVGGSCRCANNTRNTCDNPFKPDVDDCGGAVCECYFGVPIPLSSAGTPACIVNRYSQDISGTANVDTGSSSISARLRTKVFLGITTTNPCPTCAGKCSNAMTTPCGTNADCTAPGTCVQDVPNDGVQNGICFQGENNGLPCDVGGVNPSFPAIPGGAEGGGGYSLDCMPSTGINISGAGLALSVTQTTGTSTMEATLPCTGGLCQCKNCSASTTSPCSSDSDCSGASCAVSSNFQCTQNADCTNLNLGVCNGIHRCQNASNINCTSNSDCQNYNGGPCNPSTCTVIGNQGFPPEPNGCDNHLCTENPDGSGTCTDGPDDHLCDGLVRPDGRGILTCNSNSDCSANDPLNGTCSLIERRHCFTSTITATGEASTEFPVGAATFCVPPTANSSINQVAGLPGPTRVINQGSSTAFCAGDHNVEYQPGVGGCP